METAMEEKTFLSEGGVTVTNARFIVSSQTYAMSGITSVKNSQEPPKRSYPIICGLLGLLFLVGVPLLGIVLVILAIVWWIGQKSQYHVLLTTASGEMKALSSTDGDLITKVVQALNDAIVARG
jgi:ABC-type Fe3+ transport system permease subunit